MSLCKKFAIVAAMALPLVLQGCGLFVPTHKLCHDNGEDPVIGQTSYAQVFNGAAGQQKVCTVNGGELLPGAKYSFANGLLVIKGDVQQETSVRVDNGKIFVDGNVQQEARVKAEVPEETHTETRTVMMPTYNAALKMTTLTPTRQSHTVFDGFTYTQDSDPAVTIMGDVGAKADVYSNHGIHIKDSFSQSASFHATRSTEFSRVTTGSSADYQFIAPIVNNVLR